jgi:hypothetical protein
MNYLPELTFRYPDFDEIKAGKVSVGVPLFQNRIQVNCSYADATTRLCVSVSRFRNRLDEVDIHRQDDQDIAVDFWSHGGGDAHCLPVFAEPLPSLKLQRLGVTWVPVGIESAAVLYPAGFEKFVDTVAYNALMNTFSDEPRRRNCAAITTAQQRS